MSLCRLFKGYVQGYISSIMVWGLGYCRIKEEYGQMTETGFSRNPNPEPWGCRSLLNPTSGFDMLKSPTQKH